MNTAACAIPHPAPHTPAAPARARLVKLSLRPGAVLSLDSLEELLCLTGELWVTHEGDTADYVLEPGDRFSPGWAGRTVVEALEPAEIEVRR